MENLSQQSIENECNDKLQKLFIAARNARDTSDIDTAIKHYEEISALEPNNWEAFFYLVILKTNTVRNGEISNAAVSIINCLPKVFELIIETIKNDEDKKRVVKEVVEQCYETTVWLETASYNFYNNLTTNDLSFSLISAAVNMDAKRKARYESAKRMVNIGNIMCLCGNSIESVFGIEDEFYKNLAVKSWKKMIDVHFEHIKRCKVAVFSEESIQKFSAKIKKHDYSFEVPNIKPTEKRNYTIIGILIALAVLGISVFWYWWIWFL